MASLDNTVLPSNTVNINRVYKMSYIEARISDIRTLSPSVKLLQIDLNDEAFSYLPGQWINLDLNSGAMKSNATFSITSSPNGRNVIEIAVKRVEAIPSSKIIHDELQIGDAVRVSEAQGKIVLPVNLDAVPPIVFIAGGTGITPFMSMLRKIYASDPLFKATLLYSVSHIDECLFYDELKAMAKNYENFQMVLTTTQEVSRDANFFGRIDSEFLQKIGADKQTHFYLCGPPKMVDDIALDLSGLGIPAEQVHYDKWW